MFVTQHLTAILSEKAVSYRFRR